MSLRLRSLLNSYEYSYNCLFIYNKITQNSPTDNDTYYELASILSMFYNY